jgi:hypothetical protein
MKKLPKIGQIVDAYFDGKCSPSRHKNVIIVNIVHRNDLCKKALRQWKKAINKDLNNLIEGSCIIYVNGPQQFWDWNCQEFLVGYIVEEKKSENDPIKFSKKDPMLFARRPNGEWYGLNWNYYLDVGSTVRKEFMKDWEIAANECGQKMVWNKKLLKFQYFDKKTGKEIVYED